MFPQGTICRFYILIKYIDLTKEHFTIVKRIPLQSYQKCTFTNRVHYVLLH